MLARRVASHRMELDGHAIARRYPVVLRKLFGYPSLRSWMTIARKCGIQCSRIKTIPVLRELCYRDSSYSHRGVEIASITPEKCMELFGVGYYPIFIFVFERMICCFALARAKKLTLVK